jgi:predicted TIM-barrel fold metal-dependent hydrolase
MSMSTTARVPFIDAHHHLWDIDLHRYPGLADPHSPIARHYRLDNFLADAAEWPLVKSVHVQGEIDRAQSLAETAWLQSIADERGFPHGIVAFAALQDPRLDQVLQAHAQHANVRGIRQILNPDQCDRPDYLSDPAWRAGYARLADYGLSFDLQALPEQFADASAVAAAHPNVPVVVNHTGMPRDQTPAGLIRWRRAMRLLADLPHVSVKISGFGMFDPAWTTASIRPLILETIEIFGVDRCMLASNFPVDKVWASLDRLMEAFEASTADLSAAEQRKLFHDNAERTYRL